MVARGPGVRPERATKAVDGTSDAPSPLPMTGERGLAMRVDSEDCVTGSEPSLDLEGPLDAASAGVTHRRPVPMPSDRSRPYWDAAGNHQLAVQRCGDCGHWNHPPTICCPSCRSTRLTFEATTGRGTVYELAVVRQTKLTGFEDRVPYTVAAIELVEQARLIVMANIVGSPIGKVRVGDPVRVVFEEIAKDVILPQFEVEVAP